MLVDERREIADFALRAFCEVGNPSRCQGLVPCTHHPWQKLPYTVTHFCLLPHNRFFGRRRQARLGNRNRDGAPGTGPAIVRRMEHSVKGITDGLLPK